MIRLAHRNRTVRTSEQLQDAILEDLRQGPSGPYLLAERLSEPPFRVTAELKTLGRARLVAELPRYSRMWHLTASGHAHLNKRFQLEMC